MPLASTVPVDLSSHQDWADHVSDRFSAAIEIGLYDAHTKLVNSSAITFLPLTLTSPDGLPNPNCALRQICGDKLPAHGWIPRHDLFSPVAEWLKDRYADGCMLCEAGYSRIGDAILKTRAHVIHAGRPFLMLSLVDAQSDTVATVLRWGRGSRLLGACISSRCPADMSPGLPLHNGLFLCDALDGDSIVAVEVCAKH
jgi:hypothetical protein